MLDEIMSWKNAVFFLVLTAVVFIAHELSTPIENIAMTGNPVGWILLFIYYFAWFFIVGNVIGKLLEGR